METKCTDLICALEAGTGGLLGNQGERRATTPPGQHPSPARMLPLPDTVSVRVTS